MPSFIVDGGRALRGNVEIDGAKNAALPACVASLLTDEPVVLRRTPQLRDVSTILYTLRSLGKRVVRNDANVIITGEGPLRPEANPYSVRQMRASFLVLGPLLARLGRATVPLPGGCAIGRRPVDLHLRSLAALGARVEERAGLVTVCADRLRGAEIALPFPSVGATEQILMSSALANGQTTLRNGAIEPEVLDLVALLGRMGADIERSDRTFRIVGRPSLSGAEHTMIPDRMEAGTFLLAGAITGGDVGVERSAASLLEPLLRVLDETGARIVERGDSLALAAPTAPRPVDVRTAPHPGFPTDLHPPLVAYLTFVPGISRITETIFEERFAYVRHLREMGAQASVEGSTVALSGVRALSGRTVEASDIRGGAALLLAGLAATGRTTVTNVDQIDRGYARIEEKLQSVGGQIERTDS